jgi:hypothetical protein
MAEHPELSLKLALHIQLNWIGLWRLRTGADRQHDHVFGRQSD